MPIKHATKTGIIPARAGFTRQWPRACRQQWDHPRSRGVYPVTCNAVHRPWGSSPLARGLLRRAGLLDGIVGIIPARAGFTHHLRRDRACCRDHPRSRGVYENPLAFPHSPWGSSPLARGLLSKQTKYSPPTRIIPARAGFTPSPQASPSCRRDHPRSRGVYHKSFLLVARGPGSSPLARGLPHRGPRPRDHRGIIPARAGFTHRKRTPFHPSADHPRSRGVYHLPFTFYACGLGSSPLARGLPCDGLGCGAGRRIIPARAGFTRGGARGWHAVRDHPRSRGVYRELRGGQVASRGSSPLARGLRSARGRKGAHGGIIPARAGFTRA